ncbi:hypothetical protein ACSL103130_04775 [Actinomyces slackii]|uniref:DUF4276 domain-containing protein n=2 Tax=Actinomyces slackii TaxID=52774 RepID=A0A3S4UNZ7_9ACTO|nr:hypothetical protein [Actinomyces slackii]VEG74933.1 Uncharacterised protein [Actinomyces slackii]
MTVPPCVSVAVEGRSDTGMVQALLRHVGLALTRPCLEKSGSANLDKLIKRLANAPLANPWIVFRDSDSHCPVELRTQLLGQASVGEGFILRLACSMTESWLMADTTGFAEHFKVPHTRVPARPDDLPHAKQELLRLCQRSRSSQIKKDAVRQDGSPGPLYVTVINTFAQEHWDVARACESSPSLSRAVADLARLRDLLVSAQDQ